MKLKLDLYYVKTIHILNFKSMSQKVTEKSPENRVDGYRVDWQTDKRTDWLTDDGKTYRPPPVLPVGH